MRNYLLDPLANVAVGDVSKMSLGVRQRPCLPSLLCYLFFSHLISKDLSFVEIDHVQLVRVFPCRLSAPRLVCVLSCARDLRTNSIKTDKNSHRCFLAVVCGSACSTMSAAASGCGLCSFSSRSSLILVALRAASHYYRTTNLICRPVTRRCMAMWLPRLAAKETSGRTFHTPTKQITLPRWHILVSTLSASSCRVTTNPNWTSD